MTCIKLFKDGEIRIEEDDKAIKVTNFFLSKGLKNNKFCFSESGWMQSKKLAK